MTFLPPPKTFYSRLLLRVSICVPIAGLQKDGCSYKGAYAVWGGLKHPPFFRWHIKSLADGLDGGDRPDSYPHKLFPLDFTRAFCSSRYLAFAGDLVIVDGLVPCA